jgi:beta-lactamase class D
MFRPGSGIAVCSNRYSIPTARVPHQVRNLFTFAPDIRTSLFFSVMRQKVNLILLFAVLFSSCRDTRIKEHQDWGKYFEAEGIKSSGFILRDHTHDEVHYYNLSHDTTHYLPASTFKIMNALVALELGVVQDDRFVIPWDGVVRSREELNRDMDLREAFRISAVPYFQELARRIGREQMQHYLDTVRYGNRQMGPAIDSFWLDNSLQVSPDEQLGLMKRLYFNELPFSDRTQRIVRSLMLREEKEHTKFYYKTGWGLLPDKQVLWIVGFAEYTEHVKEAKGSMNKSDERNYVYFFAQNFEVPASDTTKDWGAIRIKYCTRSWIAILRSGENRAGLSCFALGFSQFIICS